MSRHGAIYRQPGATTIVIDAMHRGISPGRMLHVNFLFYLFFFFIFNNNSPERKPTNQSIDKHAHFHVTRIVRIETRNAVPKTAKRVAEVKRNLFF